MSDTIAAPSCGWIERFFEVRNVVVKDIASQMVVLQRLKAPFAIEELLLEQVRRQELETEAHAQETDDPETITLLWEIRDGLKRTR